MGRHFGSSDQTLLLLRPQTVTKLAWDETHKPHQPAVAGPPIELAPHRPKARIATEFTHPSLAARLGAELGEIGSVIAKSHIGQL
jgi:hypothetical protein